jgi:hypothetical protein
MGKGYDLRAGIAHWKAVHPANRLNEGNSNGAWSY